ncbi:MAG TPA: hypothetical protein VFQ79_07990 [Bryobacteraceae bacterium]|nr:hypothetical protein [Bryobacteraceae bacterium]
METNDNSRWVAERLLKVEPAWTPTVAQARVTLNRKLRPEPQRKAWIAASALAGLALAILALPQGRALAQELWFRLFLNRIDVVRVDLSDAPFDTDFTGSGGQRVVAGLSEAEAQAGFRPRLPVFDSWPGPPAISVIGPMTMRQTIRTSELRSALARIGASDVVVPDEWDQLTMRASMGPLVVADYPGEIQILQAKPVQLFLPTGFPLSQFAETAFRSLGLSWWEARALARRYVAQPSLLIGIPTDEAARIEEVSLRWGSGLLVEEFKDDGETERVTLVFGTKNGIYAVMSPSREVCLRVADLLPSN